MGALAAAAVAWVALLLNLPPVSRVVLLPDADGKTGAVIVKTATGEQVVNTPYASASVTQNGSIRSATEDGAKLAQQYQSTLTARPAAPISFTVYFEFGSPSDISPTDRAVLEQLRAALTSFPSAEITVIGHTDRVGSVASNDALSLQRAESVRKLIVELGIQAASIEVAGRGEREPAVPTADEVPEPKNRRVEISLR